MGTTTKWLGALGLAGVLAAACGEDEQLVGHGSGGSGASTSGTGGGGTGGAAGAGTSGAGQAGGGAGGAAGSGASGGAGGTSGAGGAAGGGGGGGDPVARGEYLVKHVSLCGECHTPHNPDGSLDMSKWLAGDPNFMDIDPADDTKGKIPSRNITPHDATGIGTWSDGEITTAFQFGTSKRTGEPLFPDMPYWIFHNMTTQDRDAIIAYLHSVTPVDSDIPDRQDLGFPWTQAAQPLAISDFPDTTLGPTHADYASAKRGQYLVNQAGVCIDCHTQDSAPGSAVPVDTQKLLLGGKQFSAAAFGLPAPPFPCVIFAGNLTPHVHGLAGWSSAQIVTALKDGLDDQGVPLCPPMPSGPAAGLGGVTDDDALDIANYLRTLSPKTDGQFPNCTPPAPSDAAPPDAGGCEPDASAGGAGGGGGASGAAGGAAAGGAGGAAGSAGAGGAGGAGATAGAGGT